MSIGRLLAWTFVAFTGFLPLNWFRLWAIGEAAAGSTLGQFLIGTLVSWGIAGALGFFLVISARGIKRRKAKEDQEFEQLLAAPLTEIQPLNVLIKADEKAYGSVMANLQETQTVGYSAGTTGMSVRVAKGLTLRTSGTRAKPIRDMVSVSFGELVITDKRVIFAGDKKSFVILLNDLIGSTNYTDGFGFSDNNNSYTLKTDNNKAHMIFSIVLNKVLRP